LFLEHLLLAALGGAAGLLIAIIGVPVLVSLLPASTPRLDEVRLDGWVVAFTVLATGLTALLSGIAPARRLARTEGLQAIGSARTGIGAPHRRLAGILVSSQIALVMHGRSWRGISCAVRWNAWRRLPVSPRPR
jgi:putative ABC transport system permease protein